MGGYGDDFDASNDKGRGGADTTEGKDEEEGGQLTVNGWHSRSGRGCNIAPLDGCWSDAGDGRRAASAHQCREETAKTLFVASNHVNYAV